MCMYVYVCVRVCVLWRSARKREACVDFGVHEQTRQNVNVLLALLIRAAAAAALASQSSQLRHEPSDIVCSCIAERERETVSERQMQNKQQSSSHARSASALSHCCCLCSALLSPALNAFNCLCFQFQWLSIVFCVLFTFFFAAACFAHVVAVLLTLALSCIRFALS